MGGDRDKKGGKVVGNKVGDIILGSLQFLSVVFFKCRFL